MFQETLLFYTSPKNCIQESFVFYHRFSEPLNIVYILQVRTVDNAAVLWQGTGMYSDALSLRCICDKIQGKLIYMTMIMISLLSAYLCL